MQYAFHCTKKHLHSYYLLAKIYKEIYQISDTIDAWNKYLQSDKSIADFLAALYYLQYFAFFTSPILPIFQ